MPEADIRAKFMDNARRSLPEEKAAEAMGLILGTLGGGAPLGEIMRSAEEK